MQDLRKQVKLLKAMQGVPYKEIAEYLELSATSFYSWLNGQYEFGEDREERLKEVLANLLEF